MNAQPATVTFNQTNKFMDTINRNATCFLCGAEIPAGVALVIRKVPIATPYGVYKDRRIVYLDCSPDWGNSPPAFYCTTCGRPVHYAKRTNLPRYCSWNCKHAAGLARPVSMVCAVCKRAFIPPRNDARTCSPACRQKAYRQRQQGAVL